MKTFAAVCACALAASTVDAKIPSPFVEQSSEFSPEGFEIAELSFGLALGAFKNFYKVKADYNCQSMMFGWGYDVYVFYPLYNGEITFSDDLGKAISLVFFWVYDGIMTYQTCRDEADGVVPEAEDDQMPVRALTNLVQGAVSVTALSDFMDDEKYFAYGVALSNSISKFMIGIDYAGGFDWF
mmetsp:Transcript_2835/g.3719  ORF Transcript_2835/g.3719 Transcript_2835/m.3719 type:complete len:183 (-) Transcript_2835:23-571(-)|eukprot:CAMPEP_0176381766 /NCGR_PEP_ID=MMETSP0126-20121128/32138_1 /TAXON_ID=141414 ORGANISM="Strombidinopsis acuminatum, Strain SPMC142" /NCGR_SAMPLE_ID=MMETSP0126 /ASSEMBLY_ACC=CAM_ASM_000229 /LENGTH=182 /DNA_ID=CAMNT_0017745775 /DNA_START=94 /DNA_END=642 /DNA_ORIENTATION=+